MVSDARNASKDIVTVMDARPGAVVSRSGPAPWAVSSAGPDGGEMAPER